MLLKSRSQDFYEVYLDSLDKQTSTEDLYAMGLLMRSVVAGEGGLRESLAEILK